MSKTFTKTALFWLAACIAWTLLVLVLSLMAQPPQPTLPLLSWDKFQHASAYALLTLLTGRSWSGLRPHRPQVWWWASGWAMLFGICIELLQKLMANGRSADFRDLLANAVGISIAILLILGWRRIRR